MIRALLPLILLSLAACNTVAGAGQDISQAGTELHNQARETQQQQQQQP